MSDELEQYLMEPTPFELTVGEFAGKMAEDAKILGKYIELSKSVAGLMKSLFELNPANAGGIKAAGVEYVALNKAYNEFIKTKPWKKINYYGDDLNFDRKGVGILGYRLDIAREYFDNIKKNPIFRIALKQYTEIDNEFWGNL
jgi:hypothetical protein